MVPEGAVLVAAAQVQGSIDISVESPEQLLSDLVAQAAVVNAARAAIAMRAGVAESHVELALEQRRSTRALLRRRLSEEIVLVLVYTITAPEIGEQTAEQIGGEIGESLSSDWAPELAAAIVESVEEAVGEGVAQTYGLKVIGIAVTNVKQVMQLVTLSTTVTETTAMATLPKRSEQSGASSLPALAVVRLLVALAAVVAMQ